MQEHRSAPPTRRTLLGGMGTAAALLAAVGPASAGKNKKSKKAAKKARKLCKRQRGQCESAVEELCALSPAPNACLNRVFDCCAHLETCNAEFAYPCLFPASTL